MSNAKSNNKNQRNKGGGRGENNNSGGRNSNDRNRSNNRRRKGGRKKKVDPKVFWGDPELLAEIPDTKASITTNPSAVVQSLGRPPLSGQQNASEHYFVAVYERAVNLAAALAAAGDLIEHEDLSTDR